MSFDSPLPPFNSSDPYGSFFSSTALELLLIEIVPLTRNIAETLSGNNGPLDDEEDRDAMFYKLESLGFKVGQGLVERFSRDRARMVESLDVIKFICKDLWTIVFRKQIDNLKTNHRGVYVLTDNSFRPFSRMSTEAGGAAISRAQPFLWFPCGIIRGALANLGVEATVQAETTELPTAVFKIEAAQKTII